MKLSARNQFKGAIVEIREGAANGVVKLDIGGGNIIGSVIKAGIASCHDIVLTSIYRSAQIAQQVFRAVSFTFMLFGTIRFRT